MVRDMDRGRGEPREPGESPGAESPERSGDGDAFYVGVLCLKKSNRIKSPSSLVILS